MVRTRRAIKQSQYRIDDDDDDESASTRQSAKGGILASINQNILPQSVKTSRTSRKSLDTENTGLKEKSISTPVRIPVRAMEQTPPPASVVLSDTGAVFSPLTQAKPLRSSSRLKKKKSNDEYNLSPTRKKIFGLDKPDYRVQVEEDDDDLVSAQVEDSITKEDNDDEETKISFRAATPVTDEHKGQSCSLTLCSASADTCSRTEARSAATTAFQEDESDTNPEEEEEEEEEDIIESEDEYIPEAEDDEESCSDEDLSAEYIDEEEQDVSARGKTKTTISAEAAISIDPQVSDPQDQSDDDADLELVSSVSVWEDSPAESPESSCRTPEKSDDEETIIEKTPFKRSPKARLTNDSIYSPEIEVAVVVEDSDDDEDAEILVATIVEEEVQSPLRNKHTPSRDWPCIDEMTSSDTVKSVGDQARENCDNWKHETNLNPSATEMVDELIDVVAEEPTTPVKTTEEQKAPNTHIARSPNTRPTQEEDQKCRSGASKPVFFRQEGQIRRGKWTLGSKIGVGSFGVVHVGMNTETGQLMAVKVFKMTGADMKDIKTEIRLLRSFDHPNIVRYLGAQMDDSHLCIFQEWVPGGSVSSLLDKFGPFAIPVMRSYISQTLTGLAYLHDNNIIHRDVKGSNILVNDAGLVKLADFGASIKLRNIQASMMTSMSVRGTPYFMAPEVFEEKYSSKADVWGVGCVAYQMLTGTAPWKEKGYSNPISLFNFIKTHEGPPTYPDSLFDRSVVKERTAQNLLDSFLKRCFTKCVEERPSADDLSDDPFFTTQQYSKDDDDTTQYKALFSPSSVCTRDSTRSPGFALPSPSGLPPPSPFQPTSRSKSVVQWKTTFQSPPRSKGKQCEHLTPSAMQGSPMHLSPLPDASQWPDWATAQLQQKNLFGKGPSTRGGQDLSDLMGSLALSEDSTAVSQNPFGRQKKRTSTIGSTGSNLIGLKFLNKASPKFEL